MTAVDGDTDANDKDDDDDALTLVATLAEI
jgi:hypothetical protein